MSPSHQMCFASEVFLLNVKNHVVFDELESMWNIPAVLQSIEGNMDILHFLSTDICPDDGSSAMIYWQVIIHRLGEGKAKLVCLLQVLDIMVLHLGKDCIPFLEGRPTS